MIIDPKIKFIIGLFITLCIGIGQGTVQLSHAIPAEWISAVTAWAGIIAFVGSAAQTTLQGFGITTQSRIANAASLPEVKSIVTTETVANAPQFASNDKVVSK